MIQCGVLLNAKHIKIEDGCVPSGSHQPEGIKSRSSQREDLTFLGDVDDRVYGTLTLDDENSFVAQGNVGSGPDGRFDLQPLVNGRRVAHFSQVLEQLAKLFILNSNEISRFFFDNLAF